MNNAATKTNIVFAGLCKGRHEIPDVHEYIFGNTIDDPMDFKAMEQAACNFIAYRKLARGNGVLQLYVTGLTPALTSVINVCCINGVRLTLMHYNRDINGYVPQRMRTREDVDMLCEGGYSGYSLRC